MGSVFIVGSHRSGTTSLVRALSLSREAVCRSEPGPHLEYESRYKFDGLLPDPYRPLLDTVGPRIADGVRRGGLYIEKQNGFVPFVAELGRLFGSKIVIPVRDGRDVAASLVDWHARVFPMIYRECVEDTAYGPHARALLNDEATLARFDYSLPRPRRGDPWARDWPTFSRFEMAAWYWNRTVLDLKAAASELPEGQTLFVDYTAPTVDTIRRVYDFVGLSDFDAEAVDRILRGKVNSLADRLNEAPAFPRWRDWDEARTRRFDDIAHDGMRAAGYVEGPRRSFVADGVLVHRNEERSAWRDHKDAWIARAGAAWSARDVLFHDEMHQAADVDDALETAIAPEVEHAFLRWAGCGEGLTDHRYRHAEGSIRVDVSGAAVRRKLASLGLTHAAMFPVAGRAGRDTVLLASRRALPPQLLPRAEDVAFDLRPYRVRSSGLDRASFERQEAAAYTHLSAEPWNLADALPALDTYLYHLKISPGRVPGHARSLGREGVNTVVRVDIDGDLPTAAAMARAGAAWGVPLSFYVLHTAPYYGAFEGDVFFRNEVVGEFLQEMQAAGAEIGLHLDPYRLHLDGLDGGQAVAEELSWLRGLGLQATGVSGHNCAPIYGVENVEVFRQYALTARRVLERDGRWAPVGALNAETLGVEYEVGRAIPGHDPDGPEGQAFATETPSGDLIRDEAWMRAYLHGNAYVRWDYDAHLFLIGRDRWALSLPGGDEAFHFGVPFYRVFELLANLGPEDRLLVTLHPEYFSARAPAA